jgi:hypothetical protein
MDANAITKLFGIVEKIAVVPPELQEGKKNESPVEQDIKNRRFEKQLESCLTAIAATCSLREECRKKVVDMKLLPYIVASLDHSNMFIRSAACNCARSLSRSVKNLRTHLVDSGICLPLIKLLSDDNDQVKITATATLCNIVLDFSPMKKTVLENGGIEMLIEHTRSMDFGLKLNAVWALKNLLYHSDSDVKEKVMRQLGWHNLEMYWL